MKHLRRHNNGAGERGQVFPIVALAMVVLIGFSALAIDLGFAYVTKANLSKAVDAAALAGSLAFAGGQSAATTAAQSAFNANYQSSGRDVNGTLPTPSITFDTDPANGFTRVNVSATAQINTFFGAIVGQKTLSAASTSQSERANVALTLVLDRSGSMSSNGGSAALPGAVSTFLSYFSDSLDQMALTSFADNATLDVSMRHNFTSTINSAVNGFSYNGATFAHGGMMLAQTQENGVNAANVLKVIVFFTDGIANTIQDNLSCPGYPLINYGGNAPSEGNGVWFMDPKTGNTQCSMTSGNTPSCCSKTAFPSQQYNTNESYTTTNITNEAQYRMLTLANTMRASNPPTLVYAIGLGSGINQSFLLSLANDPHSSTYNPSQPRGLAVIASYCPGSTCTADLRSAFEQVARDILLRLTQVQ